MTRRITIGTTAYTRTHGHAPWPHDKGQWALTLDNQATVTQRYGTYKLVLAWAKTQATTTVKVLP